MTGLAQKNGAVMSHIRIADDPEDIHAVRIAAGEADAVIGCDMVVTSSNDALAKMSKDKTRAVVNTQETMTAGFIRDKNLQFPARRLMDIDRTSTVGNNAVRGARSDRHRHARLMGDSIATNMFMLGYAWQKRHGAVVRKPPSGSDRAERRRGDGEQAGVGLGPPRRRRSDACARLPSRRRPLEFKPKRPAETVLDEIVAIRRRDLTAYQNAPTPTATSAGARGGEGRKRQGEGPTGFAEAVARNHYKLMAYKDEYEVARLYSSGEFRKQVAQTFEDGNHRMTVHLAPPLLAKRDPATGQLSRSASSAPGSSRRSLCWRNSRACAADCSTRSARRRNAKAERKLIADYEVTVKALIEGLSGETHDLAVQIADIPDDIRGYGHIKDASMACAAERQTELMRLFRDPAARRKAAVQVAAE